MGLRIKRYFSKHLVKSQEPVKNNSHKSAMNRVSVFISMKKRKLELFSSAIDIRAEQ